MSNDNKIFDFTITLYSNKCKIVKEVVAKPTELERVIDALDAEASIPRRGDGHHGYYIEVEVRRNKHVGKDKRNGNSGKRLPKSAAGQVGKVHSGGRRSQDDRKPGGDRGSAKARVRSSRDGVSRTPARKEKGRQATEGKVNGSTTRKTKGRKKG